MVEDGNVKRIVFQMWDERPAMEIILSDGLTGYKLRGYRFNRAIQIERQIEKPNLGLSSETILDTNVDSREPGQRRRGSSIFNPKSMKAKIKELTGYDLSNIVGVDSHYSEDDS